MHGFVFILNGKKYNVIKGAVPARKFLPKKTAWLQNTLYFWKKEKMNKNK